MQQGLPTTPQWPSAGGFLGLALPACAPPCQLMFMAATIRRWAGYALATTDTLLTLALVGQQSYAVLHCQSYKHVRPWRLVQGMRYDDILVTVANTVPFN